MNGTTLEAPLLSWTVPLEMSSSNAVVGTVTVRLNGYFIGVTYDITDASVGSLDKVHMWLGTTDPVTAGLSTSPGQYGWTSHSRSGSSVTIVEVCNGVNQRCMAIL